MWIIVSFIKSSKEIRKFRKLASWKVGLSAADFDKLTQNQSWRINTHVPSKKWGRTFQVQRQEPEKCLAGTGACIHSPSALDFVKRIVLPSWSLCCFFCTNVYQIIGFKIHMCTCMHTHIHTHSLERETF